MTEDANNNLGFDTYLIDVNVPTNIEATTGIKIKFFLNSSAKFIIMPHYKQRIYHNYLLGQYPIETRCYLISLKLLY